MLLCVGMVIQAQQRAANPAELRLLSLRVDAPGGRFRAAERRCSGVHGLRLGVAAPLRRPLVSHLMGLPPWPLRPPRRRAAGGRTTIPPSPPGSRPGSPRRAPVPILARPPATPARARTRSGRAVAPPTAPRHRRNRQSQRVGLLPLRRHSDPLVAIV